MNRVFRGTFGMFVAALLMSWAGCGSESDGGGGGDPGDPPGCDDGELNGDEADVDCGGSCAALCGSGQNCASANDCADGVCDAGACAAASCDDGVSNGDETDLDCGGSCSACTDGSSCDDAGDCASASCSGGICVQPSCDDGAHNGDETDVDCGGPDCGPCDAGQGCVDNSDCLSDDCQQDSTCAAATCDDQELNQGESDIDCGGPCEGCLPGQTCNAHSDCLSLSCAAGACQQAVCQDGIHNGSETGVDCGGPSCGKCGEGEGCVNDVDCLSNICDANSNLCVSCADGLENGAETDVDCGGSDCGACSEGQGCAIDEDCDTYTCDAGTNLCISYPTCLAILNAGLAAGDGMYFIDPDGGGGPLPSIPVYCDMTSDGGGWTRVANWDRENGADTVATFRSLLVEDFDNMGQFSNRGTAGQGGYIRWSDADSTYDAMAYHIDVAVPNSGQVLVDLNYHGESMEASGVWFFATAAGVQENIHCWDDTAAAAGAYGGNETPWIPGDFVCPNNNPDLATVTWNWDQPVNLSLGGEVSAFHIHSLMGDCCVDGGDSSDLYRFAFFVR